MWTNFIVGITIAASLLAIMERRDTVNQTRFAVTCESKSDSARAFFDGLVKGTAP